MCSRCMSGSLDSENKLRAYNPYLSDLFLEWFICALWNENGETKLGVEFILVNTLVVFDKL